MTGTRILLPRELVVVLFYPLRLLRLAVRYDPGVIRGAYSPRSAITHCVNVRRYAAHKRSALAAHCSGAQNCNGRTAGQHRAMLALPVAVFGFSSDASGSSSPAPRRQASGQTFSRLTRRDRVMTPAGNRRMTGGMRYGSRRGRTMAEPGLILVTGVGGGVGGVGGKVVALLHQRGRAVRAMAHHDDRADALQALAAGVSRSSRPMRW